MHWLRRSLGAVVRELTNGDSDPVFFLIVAVSVLLCGYHLTWGLPNGNYTWAADALGPLSLLSIAKRSLSQFNSGWFWYKYPFGYPLLLLAACAPYLAWLVATGQLKNPSMVYPYGFAHAESALYTLAILGRCLNLVLVVGTVVLTYAIGQRLLGRSTARLAAWFVATAYPIIYYAHTTNQDAAYLFWLTLSVWATIACAQGPEKRWPFVVLGAAVAMAMATKEQGFALLLALPVVLLPSLYRAQSAAPTPSRRAWRAVWNRVPGAALVAAVVTMLIASNAIVNPQGVVNRFLDLTGHPIKGMSSRLTPLKFSLFKGIEKELWYLQQLGDVTDSSFGLPLLIAAIGGVVYLLSAQRRAAMFLLVPALAYYFISLRTHDLLVLRYALPLFPILALAAAAVCAAWIGRARRTGIAVASLLCLLGLARAIEVDVLMRTDSRYRVEAWLAEHVPAGGSVEFYQKPVYMPRFVGLQATLIPLDERTIAGVESRRPQLIVLSSASRKGITHFWNPDWTKGSLMIERPAARAFLNALESGKLPYQRVAEFSQEPKLLRLRVTSLCPRITVYQRKADES